MAIRAPGSREEGVWLSDEQLAQCERADEADALRSPIPTRMVSNGEYMPAPQTEKQKQVEARVAELSESASKKLGVSRRQFLASTGGMAAALLAMNEVFGRFFDVSPIEMFEPEAYAAHGAPRDLFVFDDQLHCARGSSEGAPTLRALAQGPTSGFPSNPFNPTGLPDEHGNTWAPWTSSLVGLPLTPETFHVTSFIKDVFLDSQVTVGILSAATAFLFEPIGEPPRAPKNTTEATQAEIITPRMTAAVRDFVNKISGSQRLLAHGLIYPGVGNLDYIRQQAEENKPDCWKGYNITPAAKVDFDPNSDMRMWRLDDEEVAYPTYEVIASYSKRYRKTRPGWNNIAVHKGLAPGEPDIPERGNPTDIPKVARDWPKFNFIIYHSCIRPSFFNYEALEQARSGVLRRGVPDIEWTTEFAQTAAPFKNVYGEIGHTFASSVITFPTVWAHLIGQLLRFMGEDRIVFGSDCVFYGQPQWEIETFWRFQIPEALRRRWRYPLITETTKRKILGLNSARLYKLPVEKGHGHGRGRDRDDHRRLYKPVPRNYASRMTDEFKETLEFPGYVSDNLQRVRKEYLAQGWLPDHTRYGWVRKPS